MISPRSERSLSGWIGADTQPVKIIFMIPRHENFNDTLPFAPNYRMTRT